MLQGHRFTSLSKLMAFSSVNFFKKKNYSQFRALLLSSRRFSTPSIPFWKKKISFSLCCLDCLCGLAFKPTASMLPQNLSPGCFAQGGIFFTTTLIPIQLIFVSSTPFLSLPQLLSLQVTSQGLCPLGLDVCWLSSPIWLEISLLWLRGASLCYTLDIFSTRLCGSSSNFNILFLQVAKTAEVLADFCAPRFEQRLDFQIPGNTILVSCVLPRDP